MALHHRLVATGARLFWKITRPRTIGVRAVLLDGSGRVALVRHTYVDQWYLPGGGVKRRESIAAALFRELAEEVAVRDAAIDRVLGTYHNLREGKDDHVVVFVCRTDGATGELAIGDPLEIAEARWFPLDGLPDSLSPATARRIEDYRRGAVGMGDW